MAERVGPPLLLALCGLALVAVGWVGLTAPASLMTPLGIEREGASAHNEMRAAYGGMHLALGTFLLVAAVRRPLRRPALWVTLCFMGGLTLGRAVSFAIDGTPDPFVLRLLVPEALAAAAAAALLATGRTRSAGF